ncbi:MAG TPA: hypothetical protein PK371_04820 [Bacteroidales bacterium]|jgi:hypothetical protein|nr:hypothetical protein [Bacteroidales bacterium]
MNTSEKANLYRNMHRPLVDALFEEKEKLEERLNLAIKERDIKRAKVLKEKIRKIDSEARELWKKIQKEAEEL